MGEKGKQLDAFVILICWTNKCPCCLENKKQNGPMCSSTLRNTQQRTVNELVMQIGEDFKVRVSPGCVAVTLFAKMDGFIVKLFVSFYKKYGSPRRTLKKKSLILRRKIHQLS
jgi:hypothetical protein